MAPRRTKADAARLEACKQYMRVDGDEEDALILALMSAAQRYLEGAGIVPERSPPALYDLALWGLTLHYYDHRDSVGSESSFPIGLRPVITQLKLRGEAGSEPDSGRGGTAGTAGDPGVPGEQAGNLDLGNSP